MTRAIKRTLFAFSVLFLLSACASIERLAIPEKALLDQSLATTGDAHTVDHRPWDRFLKAYTVATGDGAVHLAYGTVTADHRRDLKAYIAALSDLDTTGLTRNAQLAYWTNLYNATTVDIILDHYPVQSIRQIKDGVFDLGPWENKALSIAGRPTSLHDIEHGIVRPLWSDTPEIHYILNCAAAGCPDLWQHAFTADNVEVQLSRAAAAFVNDPVHGVRVDSKGRVEVSKIYLWYREDFGGSEASILEHLMEYAAPALKTQLDEAESVRGYFYDWSLNDGPR